MNSYAKVLAAAMLYQAHELRGAREWTEETAGGAQEGREAEEMEAEGGQGTDET